MVDTSMTNTLEQVHEVIHIMRVCYLLPRLSETEFESLKQSIALEHGQGVPIIVNQNGIVLDGHNRFSACKELGIPVQYSIKEFDDPLEEKKFIIEVNLT